MAARRAFKTGYYADRFGVDERTIRRWVKAGEEKGDEIPLDDDEKMPAWWRRVYGTEPPLGVVYPGAKGKQAPTRRRRNRVEVGEEDLSPRSMLERLATAEATLAKKLSALLESEASAVEISKHLSDWNTITESVRKFRRSLLEEEKEMGIWVRKKDVEEKLESMHRPLANGVRGLGRRWAGVVGLPWSKEYEAEFQRLAEKLFGALEGFWTGDTEQAEDLELKYE